MKNLFSNRKKSLFLIVCTFFIASGFALLENEQLIIKYIMQSIYAKHYTSKTIDNSFSEKVFDEYIKSLDYSKKFLVQSDIVALGKYKDAIDEELNDGSRELVTAADAAFFKRVQEVQAYSTDILSKPFSFDGQEMYEADVDKIGFCKDEAELKARWTQFLKLRVLERLSSSLDEQEKNKPESPKSFAVLEQEARVKILKSQNEYFKRVLQMEDIDKLSLFLNAVTSVYDPHTSFFPPKAKEDFNISMSGQLEGIGARLLPEDGFLKIDEIIPGSPSYRQGELKAGDFILKVAQGSDEAVDIENMRQDDAIRLIRGKKGTEVRLTIKKADGQTKIISLIRDIIQFEDTFAKSAIINNGKERVGYIFLPKFYANFETAGGRSCAKDVAIEVAHLKKEKVTGIILDLRGNGGGSLSDVIDMSGLFIKNGPVVQVKSRDKAPEVFNDNDPKIQFDGPMAVMVNGFSASASEILAAAMQDYERAVIVGTPTFGKGTVQRVFNLPTNAGAIKMTIQKFYRINGGATQLRGVTPDVVLPDLYAGMKVGEKEDKFAMAWDEIPAQKYDTYGLNTPKMAQIRKNSQKRTAASPDFISLEKQAKHYQKLRDNTKISLNLQEYRLKIKEDRAANKQFEDGSNNVVGNFKFETPSDDQALVSSDTVRTRLQNDWFGKLGKDAQLFETVHIVKDLNK